MKNILSFKFKYGLVTNINYHRNHPLSIFYCQEHATFSKMLEHCYYGLPGLKIALHQTTVQLDEILSF